MQVSQKLKYPDTSNWAEGVSVHASALELSRNLASSPSVQWSCSPFPFFNCQPRFYTLMQIKHINPFHLVGVGMKHCKKAKQTKGFPDQTLYTLKSPKTCLFWWDFENIWEVFYVDQKIERKRRATAILPVLLLCVELIAKPLLCILWLNVLPRPWKSIKWVMFSSIWTISTIWNCIVVTYLTMQCHIRICAHMMKCCAEMQH